MRSRLEGIARVAGADFETLDIAVIDVPVLRLDHRNDRQGLQDTVARILVLDPLVRLHGVDENAVADIAPILGFLRDLQRRFETAVLLVHHARKSGATRPGQALRGSSEPHAWGDSNLYLRRRDKQIVMIVEYRAAAGLNDIEIELANDGQGPALRLRRAVPDEAVPEPKTPEQQRIVQVLADAEGPLSQRQIREQAATRPATVTGALQKLVREHRVERDRPRARSQRRCLPEGPRRDPVSVRCRQSRTIPIQAGFDPAGNPPRRLVHGIPLQVRIPRGRLHLAMAEQAADHRQALAERQRTRRE